MQVDLLNFNINRNKETLYLKINLLIFNYSAYLNTRISSRQTRLRYNPMYIRAY